MSLQVDALGADSGKNNSFGGARGTRDGVLRELEAADDFDRPSCSCLVHLWLHWAADVITETVFFKASILGQIDVIRSVIHRSRVFGARSGEGKLVRIWV